jgi:hypothetical protein
LVSIVYEEEAVDNDEEEEALKVEYKSETNKKDNYNEQIPWRLPEVIHKQDSNKVIQAGGVISVERNSGSEVLDQEVAHSQEGLTAFETAPGTGSSQPLRNHGTEKYPYTPLDILLVPGSNTSVDVSGIDYEFSEDSNNENSRDTKIGSEQPSTDTTPFLKTSET